MTKPILATKLPVTNEAWQWDGTDETAKLILNWIDAQGGYAYMHPHERWIILPECMDPVMESDWVIRDQFNEFYPCQDRTFKAVYKSPVLR